MTINRFTDLLVWQKAVDFVVRLYEVTRSFPKEEVYGMTGQLRRAAISIPSNIAEGHGRGSTGDYLRFLGMAQGSTSEVETQIVIASRLQYLTKENGDELLSDLSEIGRMLNGLVSSLKRRNEERP
jgi:four helix bundle protein